MQLLRKTQNADGGWAYYAGKASWAEPTALAALALHGTPESDRAWALLRSWTLSSGAVKPAAEVTEAGWTTALTVILGQARREPQNPGLEWLKKSARDGAWPWHNGNAPAAEPTGWAVVALRRAGGPVDSGYLLRQDLTPETCGPALLALQGSQDAKLLAPLAERWRAESPSALTRAWLTLGLRLNGFDPADAWGPAPRNLAIVALEAIAARGGNFKLLGASA